MRHRRIIAEGARAAGAFAGIAFAILAAAAPPLASQRITPLPPPCAFGQASATRTVDRVSGRSIAILPLVIGDGGDRVSYLANGLADAVAHRIAHAAPNIDVIGRGSLRHAATDDLTAIRGVGAELETRYLVSGVVASSRDGIRITLGLADGKLGKRLWQQTFSYDSLGGFAIVRTAATEITSRILGSLAAKEIEILSSAPTKNRTAYDWYLRGNAAMDASAFDRAAAAFRHAAQLDPSFVDAYAKLALADAASVNDGAERGAGNIVLLNELRAAAAKAVTGDPKSARAWLAEARARLLDGRSTASWRAAFDQALKLDARDPMLLEQYGLALAQTDDRAAARDLLRRAAALLPRRAEISTALAELAVEEDNDGAACGLLNQAISDDALYGPAWAARALLRARHGDLRFAWADAETATQVGSPLLGGSASAIVDMKARDTVRARARLDELRTDLEARQTISVSEGRAVARAFIEAGEMSRALDALESVRPRGRLFAAISRDPSLDRARREPRFRAMVAPRPEGAPEVRDRTGKLFVDLRRPSRVPLVAPQGP